MVGAVVGTVTTRRQVLGRRLSIWPWLAPVTGAPSSARGRLQIVAIVLASRKQAWNWSWSDRIHLVVAGTDPRMVARSAGPAGSRSTAKFSELAPIAIRVLTSVPRHAGWRRDADPIGLRPGYGDPCSRDRLLWTCMAVSLRWALLTPVAWRRWCAARIGDIRAGTLRFSPTVRGTIWLRPGRTCPGRSRIRGKTGCRRRADLTRVALDQGLAKRGPGLNLGHRKVTRRTQNWRICPPVPD